jgi:hypothetical protein
MFTKSGRPDSFIQDSLRIIFPTLELITHNNHFRLTIFVSDERISHPVCFEMDCEL